jgi:hypothetical protein
MASNLKAERHSPITTTKPDDIARSRSDSTTNEHGQCLSALAMKKIEKSKL